MPKKPLELELMQGQRHYATRESTADPDDVAALERALSDWLDDLRFKNPARRRFSMDVREAGKWRILKTIREPG
jgi:hypothetical protein